MKGFFKSKLVLPLAALIMIAAAAAIPLASSITHSHAAPALAAKANHTITGNLDCNGYSKLQKLGHYICADTGREDNGHYIGHDEPSVQFLSNTPGSGNNVEWVITLPKEHALPATQTFENQVTFWFSMILCDPKSFPFNPCTPDSDTNPPAHFAGDTTTAGSAILELQFYPPGETFFSCSTTTWCAKMTIDSFENNALCNEPIQGQYIQTNDVPVPGGTFNAKTLQMGQGDKLQITIMDTPSGLLNQVNDDTTGKSGSMVASAANGFVNTDHTTCATTPFSFHPEFSTAKFGNFLPWGAQQVNVGFASEIGHFEAANGDADDSECTAGPVVPGCYDLSSGGDKDFDGTSYKADWPDGTSITPTPVVISSDTGNGIGPLSAPNGKSGPHKSPYRALMFETDILGTELATGTCCHLPPTGATFYPFYAQTDFGSKCTLTIGNDIRGLTVNDFGRDAQYGSQNLAWSSAQSSGGIRPNPCIPRGTPH